MNTETPKYEFKGIWIPVELWHHRELSLFQKVLLAEIFFLEKDDQGCYASNDFFAKFFGVTVRAVSGAISELARIGMIRVEIDQAKGNVRMIYTLWNKTSIPYGTQLRDGIEKSRIDSYSKRKKEKQEQIPLPFDSKEFESAWSLWMEYRKQSRKPLTPIGVKLQLDRLKNMGEIVAIESIHRSVENGWQGIFPQKNWNSKPKVKPQY